MAEYIDRERLKQCFHANICGGNAYDELIDMQPTADVIERSTMEILCIEYLSKNNCCDECCAEYFCIENQLRTEKRDCVNNLITYFAKRNIGE